MTQFVNTVVPDIEIIDGEKQRKEKLFSIIDRFDKINHNALKRIVCDEEKLMSDHAFRKALKQLHLEQKIVEIPSGRQSKYYSVELDRLPAEQNLEKLLDQRISEIDIRFKAIQKKYSILSYSEKTELAESLFKLTFFDTTKFDLIVPVKDNFTIQDKIKQIQNYKSELLDFIVSEEGFSLNIPKYLYCILDDESNKATTEFDRILNNADTTHNINRD